MARNPKAQRKHKSSNNAKLPVSGSCRATVDRCTLQQLNSIGIDENLIGREVELVGKSNFHNPLYGKCANVRVDNMFAGLSLNATYLIPIEWMSFGNCH